MPPVYTGDCSCVPFYTYCFWIASVFSDPFPTPILVLQHLHHFWLPGIIFRLNSCVPYSIIQVINKNIVPGLVEPNRYLLPVWKWTIIPYILLSQYCFPINFALMLVSWSVMDSKLQLQYFYSRFWDMHQKIFSFQIPGWICTTD